MKKPVVGVPLDRQGRVLTNVNGAVTSPFGSKPGSASGCPYRWDQSGGRNWRYTSALVQGVLSTDLCKLTRFVSLMIPLAERTNLAQSHPP